MFNRCERSLGWWEGGFCKRESLCHQTRLPTVSGIAGTDAEMVSRQTVAAEEPDANEPDVPIFAAAEFATAMTDDWTGALEEAGVNEPDLSAAGAEAAELTAAVPAVGKLVSC